MKFFEVLLGFSGFILISALGLKQIFKAKPVRNVVNQKNKKICKQTLPFFAEQEEYLKEKIEEYTGDPHQAFKLKRLRNSKARLSMCQRMAKVLADVCDNSEPVDDTFILKIIDLGISKENVKFCFLPNLTRNNVITIDPWSGKDLAFQDSVKSQFKESLKAANYGTTDPSRWTYLRKGLGLEDTTWELFEKDLERVKTEKYDIF
uniref:Uncharacterized protein n=1 Tax=Chromera velia CCMP2878 TaxID=1169474 RepID=A0A0G4FVD0_9ALVE|eukprot:Cvel_476.t1-p1 / transcript=Cvel_476.t1 / gene=Cvel_476 / organism=Chromera_velia_CCMP2878 / gene_product=hypothetical protein / transcript_product=hypothetical protein / location=Cvel_scaffold15:60118-60729(+) / protein_length=204 / sequence_SO=supercontig / SO=protein_coding / is_pseudo=false